MKPTLCLLGNRFVEGIKLDRESWFSVTPEYDVVLDAFCGADGNTIQFARTCNRVVAIDIDPNKIAMTKHNATIYGVHEKIEFITSDFFELAPRLKAGMVFLTPPWGGPSYSKAKEYDDESMLRPRPASELMQVARTISPNVELFLHRYTRLDQFTPGFWASSSQEEFSLMSSLGRRVRDLSQDLVHQRALPLVESRDPRGKTWELLFIYRGCTVYKASGAPVDTFLCRPLKGTDLLRVIPSLLKRYHDISLDLSYGPEYRGTTTTLDAKITITSIRSQHQSISTIYCEAKYPRSMTHHHHILARGRPTMSHHRRTGHCTARRYYEPPPPYIETTPAPRPQPVPVQYEASRPCKLGRNLRKDLFYINVLVPITMPANFSHLPTIFHSRIYLLSSIQAPTYYLPFKPLPSIFHYLFYFFTTIRVGWSGDLVNSGTFTPKSAGLPCIIDGWTTAELRATYLLNRLLIQDSGSTRASSWTARTCFSVTPEVVARHIAEKYQYDVVLDAFCGAGGNTIQFARTCNRVVAIDIDPNKIAMTKHNATIYGVHEKIEFITGDFFELAPRLKADMVFLSPPWGGPSYSKAKEYDVESMLRPRPASELMQVARTISPNVELFLPRNTRHDQFTPGLWASSTQEEFSLMLAVGCSVYKASGAPVDAFLCRTPKDEDHRRAIPNIFIKKIAMEYSGNSSSLRSGAEPQQQRCRRCDGRCGHSVFTTSSNIVERLPVRQRVGLTEYRGGPSRSRTPPPRYSVPAPQVDAPAPQVNAPAPQIVM
ncbi:hypothetical protein SFRURICE_014414 [Spodoptera frugiperda]|nr:hypothetical protein SFRURICE_014414 [Spodoptera frugiperda]